MHESCDLYNGDSNTENDHDRTSDAGKEDENSEENGHQRRSNILVNLLPNHLVHNPIGVPCYRVIVYTTL